MKSVVVRSLSGLAVLLMVAACSLDIGAPADPRTAAFDEWLDKARPVFAGSGPGLELGLDSLLHEYQCTDGEIGDGAQTEPACSGFRALSVGDKQVVIEADWSISHPQRWHADITLDSLLTFECGQVQSSVEYYRGANKVAELVACRTQAGDEVVFLNAPAAVDNLTVAYLSAAFVQAYPGYVTGLIQTVESSP